MDAWVSAGWNSRLTVPAMASEPVVDRVGLGWRGELAAAILQRIEALDVLEVIAEDWIHGSRRECAALHSLARQRPLLLHGVSLGLACCEPVCLRRLDRMARLVDQVMPERWSEHLAFVRASGIEIGHLAAPPRTEANVAGTLANLERAARVIGALPCLENIATLIDPPASTLDEGAWTTVIVKASGAPMLLDLHNLYANALNFGTEPLELMQAMPLDRVSLVHLSGGRWIAPRGRRPRLLDDHLHDVPGEVYGLLETLALWVPQPLTVIIERDGNYPSFDDLLAQVAEARQALARGRALRLEQAA
ncbi:MAG: DUF692 domain-containing protein [Methylococcaceae bacterium]|nr:DUF692 domain-containing protein [Methylococcaceae bacterium]